MNTSPCSFQKWGLVTRSTKGCRAICTVWVRRGYGEGGVEVNTHKVRSWCGHDIQKQQHRKVTSKGIAYSVTAQAAGHRQQEYV
jgi:hypothetical protein